MLKHSPPGVGTCTSGRILPCASPPVNRAPNRYPFMFRTLAAAPLIGMPIWYFAVPSPAPRLPPYDRPEAHNDDDFLYTPARVGRPAALLLP